MPPVTASDPVRETFRSALARADRRTDPFGHWLLDRPWPDAVAQQMEALPIAVSDMTYRLGRREENNAARAYFDPAQQARLPACRAVAEALQDPRTIAAIEALCDVDLTGSYLRIEYAQDTEGFWLEPHTDIGVKRFTLLAPLTSGPEAADWGTDFYAGPDQPAQRQPFRANTALIFVPSESTWHGFEARPITGVRRSLIINYVGPEWRARHELCFPDQPIG
ncbi:2OG-Fe(II) oxygenase [Roseospira navarrensis]|uniref:2OG-Fe(II) oxygenase n=2 Tax=Roseospira navarrensis TaxID=140058 RepID=A0A7X2D2N0_9PROT|nr:2OG-Fe(II) oxygenase [Roseospira navarrensis]